MRVAARHALPYRVVEGSGISREDYERLVRAATGVRRYVVVADFTVEGDTLTARPRVGRADG